MEKSKRPKPKIITLLDTGKLLREYFDWHRIHQSALSRKIKRAPKTALAKIKSSKGNRNSVKANGNAFLCSE